NTSTISVQATDSGFGAAAGNTATQSVSIANVAPSITISGAASVNEGSSYSLTLGAVSDPGTDTVSSYIVHWGDGNTSTYLTNGAKTHTYADGPNNYNITVDLTDEDGTFLDRANALSVTVNNVAPSATFNASSPVDEGSNISLSLTDPSDPSSVDTAAGFQYRFSCDNGTSWSLWSSTASASCSTNDNGTDHNSAGLSSSHQVIST